MVMLQSCLKRGLLIQIMERTWEAKRRCFQYLRLAVVDFRMDHYWILLPPPPTFFMVQLHGQFFCLWKCLLLPTKTPYFIPPPAALRSIYHCLPVVLLICTPSQHGLRIFGSSLVRSFAKFFLSR